MKRFLKEAFLEHPWQCHISGLVMSLSTFWFLEQYMQWGFWLSIFLASTTGGVGSFVAHKLVGPHSNPN